MNCAAFERWLDEGLPAAAAAEARAHAAACQACAAWLEPAEAVERALAETPAIAPSGFTQRVMERVTAERMRPVLATPALAWWIRAIMEPATAFALLIGALLLWGWDGLWSLATAAGLGLAQSAAGLAGSWGGVSATGALALELAGGLLLWASAHALYRGAARVATWIPLTRA